MLKGERPNPSTGLRIARALVVAFALVPLVVLMVVIAKLALADLEPDQRGYWPQAAVLFLIVYGAMLYIGLWRMTRLTVRRFAFDGRTLELETPRHGRVTRPVADLRLVTEELRGRHGQLLRGWWLGFASIGSVYLPRELPNAELLVTQLGPLVRPGAGPGATPDSAV